MKDQEKFIEAIKNGSLDLSKIRVVKADAPIAQDVYALVDEYWPADVMAENLQNRREHIKEVVDDIFAHGEQCSIFVAYCGKIPVGFLQINVRGDLVEGATRPPVGYIEALYLTEFGKALPPVLHLLYKSALVFAAQHGLSEIAADRLTSDYELCDHLLDLKFEEVSTRTHFIKKVPFKTVRN